MKAKIVIEDGKSEIVLTPENKFEISVLEDLDGHNLDRHDITTKVISEYNYGSRSNYKLVVRIIEKPISC